MISDRVPSWDYRKYDDWMEDTLEVAGWYVVSLPYVECELPLAKPKWVRIREYFYRAAERVQAVVVELGVREMFVQQEGILFPWFPEHIKTNRCYGKQLSQFLLVKPVEGSPVPEGRIVLKVEDLADFLCLFLAYPDRFRYCAIDLYCDVIPVVVKITHHIDLQVVTLTAEMAERFESKFRTDGYTVVRGGQFSLTDPSQDNAVGDR
jgi:hypothetical protein